MAPGGDGVNYFFNSKRSKARFRVPGGLVREEALTGLTLGGPETPMPSPTADKAELLFVVQHSPDQSGLSRPRRPSRSSSAFGLSRYSAKREGGSARADKRRFPSRSR